MTLRIMVPASIGLGDITATNVALEAEWVAGTYTLGQQFRVGEVLYEVSAASTTEQPSETATDWFNAGPINQLAAFDQQIGLDQFRAVETKTKNADSITYSFIASELVTGIALFGLVADTIRIVGTVSTTGDVADIDIDLNDGVDYSGSLWDWLFVAPEQTRKYLNFDISFPSGTQIDIEIINTGEIAEVGTIAFGTVSEQGTLEIEAARSLKSRSIKRTTGTTTSLLRRTPSAKVSYPVTLEGFLGERFWQTVEDIDGIGAVFAGPTSHPELAVYGFITSAQTTAKGVGISKVSVEVESL